MKKLLTAFALITPLLAFAQLEKGVVLLNGNLSFTKNNFGEQIQAFGDVPEITMVEFSPRVGYMISPKLAIGVMGSYSKNDQKASPVNGYTGNRTTLETYGFGPFVRYYHLIGEKFYVFAQGDISYYKTENSTSTIGGDPLSRSYGTTRIAVRPGISYFLGKRLALEVMLGSIFYSKSNFSGDGATNKDGFGFRFLTQGLSPGVTFTL